MTLSALTNHYLSDAFVFMQRGYNCVSSSCQSACSALSDAKPYASSAANKACAVASRLSVPMRMGFNWASNGGQYVYAVVSDGSALARPYISSAANRVCVVGSRFLHDIPVYMRTGLTWASNGGQRVYSALSDITALLRPHVVKAMNTVYAFLLAHKKWMSVGVAISVVALRIIKYLRSRPEYPTVTWASSLNHAQLSIQVPTQELLPPNVTLVFCVDTSGSMKGDREGQVKGGLNSILDAAVEEVARGASIKIGVVGFTNKARTICEPTSVTSESVAGIKGAVGDYTSNGSTKIAVGLDAATTQLEAMARTTSSATHTFVVLTDGDEVLGESAVQGIHSRLAAIQARVFGIGIGAGHKKKTVKLIASDKGDYIDTTEENVSIAGAISDVYEQAIADFTDLRLSSSLEVGTWSVNGTASVESDGRSACQLGNVSRGVQKELKIQINTETLTSRLDLSQVSFTLHFKDADGREGTMSIPWKPNSIVDPAILRGV